MIERIRWGLLAAIHAVPALAAFRPALLTRLYGVDQGESSFILLQHRAALFLVVMIVCGWAAVAPAVRPLAVAAAISMISFLLLFHAAGMPPALRTIAIADWIGLAPLLYVVWRAFGAAGR